MSLIYAENLLRQYNKNANTVKTQSDAGSKGKPRFFTESYLNQYDSLYNKFKDNKNFNIQMWRQAFKNGEQDSYLGLLEQDRDTEMSKQFYDPMYYDYETMMLELYKPIASATELDKETAKTVKELGLENTITNDQAYIQYQLDQIHNIREQKIKLDLEQERKDQLGWWGQFGNDIAATLAEFGEGLLTGLAGIVDLVISPFYATGAAIGGEDWLDSFVDYFGSKGLTALEKESVRAALDEYERTHTHFMDINGNVTGIGKYVAGISNSIGMMVPAIIANCFTGGTASLAWVGPTTFYASIFSGNMHDNAINPYVANSPSWLKIANATVKTGVEAVIEWSLGKVLGGTIQNAAIGMAGGKIGSGLIKGMSKTAGIKYLLKSAGQEGLEEFLQDFSTNLADQFTNLLYEGYGNTGVTFQTLVDSFCIGALSSLFMSGGQIAINGIGKSIKNRKYENETGIKDIADLYIEVDGKPKKLTGANKLYYSSIISQFNNAVKTLNDSKIANKKTLSLAKEVYAALDVMSQFYSSFSKERIENAEKLLNRVMAAEQTEFDSVRKDPNDIKLSDKEIKARIKTNATDAVHSFAATVANDFSAMVSGVKTRLADTERVRKAAETVGEELKEGGVTTTKYVIDIDGVKRKINPKLQSLVDELENDKVNDSKEDKTVADERLKELHSDYDIIFTTDGHIAVEEDGVLFVSEAWLENYETSEIYKFLAQTRILKTVAQDKELQPLVESIIKFDEEFTKQKNVTAERALMDLLFNKSVYQAFLLSHNGANLMQFKDFIFRLQDIIKLLGEDKIDTNTKISPATKAKKKAYLNKIYEQIKDTMRMPTIKAILNWNMNAQLIGADSILTKADRDFINQYQARKRLASEEGKSGPISMAYEHISEDIVKESSFTTEELRLIENGLSDNADEKSRLIALALLNEADDYVSSKDRDLKRTRPDFILPIEAFAGKEESSMAIQYKADKLLEFEKLYGVPAKQLIQGKVSGMSFEQAERMNQDMSVLGVNDYVSFVQYKLETMLGSDYIVVPKYDIAYDETRRECIGFNIVRSIKGEDLLFPELLGDKSEENIRALFVNQVAHPDEFVKIKGLKDWEICAVSEENNELDKYASLDDKRIFIDLAASDDAASTLIRALNHIIQYEYNMSSGFSKKTAEKMPDFLQYVAENYKAVIDYVCRREGLSITNRLTELTESSKYRSIVAEVAHNLVQGELWATRTEHNAKPLRGFAVTYDKTHRATFVVSPDNKHVFELPFSNNTESSTELPYKKAEDMTLPVHYIDNVIAREFNTIFKTRLSLYTKSGADNENIRNTYHSGLSTKSSLELTLPLMNATLSLLTKLRTTINDIILEPQIYLNSALLDKLGDDLSEGHVFYFLKDYVENKFGSISIDRSANTHEYIFVDDNAFDDLLTDKMLYLANDNKGTYLADHYEGTHKLSEFYDKKKLAMFRIDDSVQVKLVPNNNSYTSFDRNNAIGTIYIGTVHNGKTRTNDQIIATLNHEFRHVMQAYNDLETGFTTNFVVTPEMVNDLKAKVPEIFKDKDVNDVLQRSNIKNKEEYIVKRFIYFLVGGEKNAYGIKASLLNAKPIYITNEAGQYTIFMPWYDANTGDGRYVTKINKERRSAEDNGEEDDARIKTPRVNRTPKYSQKIVEELSPEERLKKYIYEGRRREVLVKDSRGNNLQYFRKKGERTQIDKDLYDFILATTGNENKLPPSIVNAIKRGVLTKQSLYKWFRQTDAKNINQFTFDLINKYMFKNTYINDMSELDRITTIEPSFYWAASIVLAKEGLPLESLIKENNIDRLLTFLNSLEGTQWKQKIEKLQLKFDWYKTDKGVENYALDEKISNYMRVFTMQWFDGTLAGAFYTAKAFRKTIKAFEEESANSVSLDAEKKNSKGDKSTTLADTISNEDALNGTRVNYIANDIEALYDKNKNILPEEMIAELVRLKYLQEVESTVNTLSVSQKDKEKIKSWLIERDKLIRNFRKLTIKTDPTNAEILLRKQLSFVVSKLEKILHKMAAYQTALDEMSLDEISSRYAEIINAEMIDAEVPQQVTDENNNAYRKTRINIVNRIKGAANAILRMIRNGEVAFSDLPKEVQAMFELKTYNVQGNKKVQSYELKPEVYSVGRGVAQLPGQTGGRMLYSGKRNLANSSQTQKHSVDQILKNEELLNLTRSVIKQNKQKKNNDAGKKIKEVKRLQNIIDARLDKKNLSSNKNKEKTAFRVTAKRRTSDTPNNFVVNSDVVMPEMLRKILDTSFEDMANTEVQFASRTKDGALFDKEKIDKRKFDGRLKHEINSWEAFYEANRTQLLALTRQDVLDIVEFFQVANMTSLDGPSNKLTAFEIFILGYIVDAARRNLNNWDFSDSEKELIEKLYEKKASSYGSGLNAVSQMLSVIDPFKRVRQKALDDFNIDEEELEPLLSAVDELQNAKTKKEREHYEQVVAKELDKVEKLMVEGDPREKGFGKNWFKKLKSARYSFMLSSPITWIRNIISNAIVTNLNSVSDVIGNFFAKKGYRENQWDFSKVQVSSEVKSFIDDNIKTNSVLESLYENTSKYDTRQDKALDSKKDLFINMIVRALENKYAAEHRFDNKTANAISKFITQMISDKRFIKHATEKYFGKILTLELQKGNVDLEHGLSNKVLNLFAEAVILSNNDYMHKRSFLADNISKLRDTSPVAYEVLTFWQPFLNSSLNWFKEMLKYSPIGMITSIVNLCKLEKTITKIGVKRAKGEVLPDNRAIEYLARRDVGKGVIGMTFTILGILLGSFGVIRIEDDDDKFYIHVGDLKFDITNIFGTSSILVGASLAQVWAQSKSDIGFDEVMRMVTAQMFEGFILNDLLGRHQWDEGLWDFMLTESESVLRSFVPQFIQLLIRTTNNEKIKYTPGFVGMWERWLNTFVPLQPIGTRRINPYTGEVETKYALPFFGELLKSGLLGPKIFWSEVSEEELFAREYGVNKGELTGKLTINGKKYSVDKNALNAKYGQLNKITLAQLKSQKHYVEMPNGKYKTLSWDKLSDAQRTTVINRELTKNADIAMIFVWTQQMNNKYYASDTLWYTLKRLGWVNNIYRGDKGFVE